MIAHWVQFVSGLVTLAAAICVTRLATRPAIRRELREHPRLALPLLGTTALLASGLAWTAWSRPVMLHGIALATAGLLLAAWRHARSDYGRRRGLPPGSLGLGRSLDAITDIEFYANAAKQWGPIFKMSHVHRPVVCVTHLPLAVELLRRDDGALRQVDWPFDRVVPGGYVEFMNDDRHAMLRELLGRGFAEPVVAQCRLSFQRLLEDSLGAMARDSRTGGIDPEPFLNRVALGCLVRIVLGVEPDDERVATVPRLLTGLDGVISPFLPVPSGVRRAFDELTGVVRQLGDSAGSANGRASVGASVLGEIVRIDTKLARDPALTGNLVAMVHDGRTMLRRLLLWVLKLGCEHRDRVVAFRTAPLAGPGSRDALTRHFVLEVLRMWMTPYVYRKVARDLDLGPYRIPRGWLLRVCLREAHRRQDVFPAPDAFDPTRFSARSFGATEFLPFSSGPHACLADGFVMAVAETFFATFAQRFDGRVVRDGPVEPMHNRHWAYWRPSRDLRVSVTPRLDGRMPPRTLGRDEGAGT